MMMKMKKARKKYVKVTKLFNVFVPVLSKQKWEDCLMPFYLSSWNASSKPFRMTVLILWYEYAIIYLAISFNVANSASFQYYVSAVEIPESLIKSQRVPSICICSSGSCGQIINQKGCSHTLVWMTHTQAWMTTAGTFAADYVCHF